MLESSSELVNAFVDFSQNTVVSETHARHSKKLVVCVIVQRGGDGQLSRVKKNYIVQKNDWNGVNCLAHRSRRLE